jgi:hypothetical protein
MKHKKLKILRPCVVGLFARPDSRPAHNQVIGTKGWVILHHLPFCFLKKCCWDGYLADGLHICVVFGVCVCGVVVVGRNHQTQTS